VKMKVFVFIVFLGLALGASAQIGERNQKIHDLQANVAKLSAAVRRFIRIGKQNVGRLESVMNAVDEDRRKCLQLETLRPGPIALTVLPAIALKPVRGAPLSLSQISARINGLDQSVNKIITATTRYVSIGKGNIGLMQRFAEASRRTVCGDDHHSLCPIGFIHNAVTHSCFRELVGRQKSFADAQSLCHRMGGHLPRVESADANNALPGLLQLGITSLSSQDNLHALWIGLQRNAEGAWQWVHPEDSPVDLTTGDSFKNFSSEEEDDALGCAYLCTMSNKWIKTSCDTRTRVLCEKATNPAPADD